MTYHQHLILLPVAINGFDAGLALLDTGASACALDQRLAERLGVSATDEVDVHGTVGVTKARSATLQSLEAFGRRVERVETTVYPLSLLPAPGGEPVSFIIGYPFLKNFAVEIDFGRRRLTLHDRPVKSPHSLPMRLDNGIPRVAAELNGSVPVEFRIDTGASLFDTADVYLNLTSQDLERLRARGFEREPELHFSGTGVGGAVKLPVFRLDGATLGAIRLDRPMAIVQPRQGVFSDSEMPGFIANYTLDNQGRVVIDYLDSTLDFLE